MTLRELINQLENVILDGISESSTVDRILPAMKSPEVVVADPVDESTVVLRLLRAKDDRIHTMLSERAKSKLDKIKKEKK